MMKFIQILLFTIYSNTIFAQNILIVKDLDSNKPLMGATVLNLSDQTVLTSDFNGAVPIASLKIGTHLSISYIGYKTTNHTLGDGQQLVYLEPDYQMHNTPTAVGS